MRRMRESDVVLAVIGPHWTEAADDRARRSLRDSTDQDLVRLEIETAFTHGAAVIPVLVDDAEMPARGSLPRPFRPLVEAQAQTLHHSSWDRDVDALAEASPTSPGGSAARGAVQAARQPARPAGPDGRRAGRGLHDGAPGRD